MLKTEAEARKCWCPMSRCIQSVTMNASTATARVEQPSFNVVKGRELEQSNHGVCVGSACMMWRSPEKEYTLNKEGRQRLTSGEQLDDSCKDYIKDRKGYCGLAGTVFFP